MKLLQSIFEKLGIRNPSTVMMTLGEWVPTDEWRGDENMSESNSSIQIDVGISTEVMTAKLRAIAKHAEALANELDEIDSAKCEECGRILNITRLYGDSEEVEELRECPRCDQHE